MTNRGQGALWLAVYTTEQRSERIQNPSQSCAAVEPHEELVAMLGSGPAPARAAVGLSRLLSTSSAPAGLSLVRDFIYDSLYNPAYGYFSNPVVPVGTLRQPIDFASLYGRNDYLRHVQQIYKDLQVSWLTPVEIFQPHYGSAIARYLAQHYVDHREEHAMSYKKQTQPPLRIYEVGGGTGTLALNILDWLRQHQPELYASCRYTCIEISPSLAQRQQQRVAVGGGHGACFIVVQQDGGSETAWGPPSEEPCYIIMMEVLDNLPHDRVWRQRAGEPWQQTMVASIDTSSKGSSSDGGSGGLSSPFPPQHLLQRWQQEGPEQQQQQQIQHLPGLQDRRPLAVSSEEQSFREVLEPVTDPLILRCLGAYEQQQEAAEASSRGGPLWTLPSLQHWVDALVGGPPQGEAVFLPSGCLQLLDTLHRARPRHHLIAADFDALPEVVIPGVNAPLVATTVGGQTTDHGTYLVPKGVADIFFPTDFSLLARLYHDAAQRPQQHHQQGPKAGAGSPAAKQRAKRAQHMTTAEFMRRFAAAEAARAGTQSGYNPLLEDYTNTSFFLGGGSSAC